MAWTVCWAFNRACLHTLATQTCSIHACSLPLHIALPDLASPACEGRELGGLLQLRYEFMTSTKRASHTSFFRFGIPMLEPHRCYLVRCSAALFFDDEFIMPRSGSDRDKPSSSSRMTVPTGDVYFTFHSSGDLSLRIGNEQERLLKHSIVSRSKLLCELSDTSRDQDPASAIRVDTHPILVKAWLILKCLRATIMQGTHASFKRCRWARSCDNVAAERTCSSEKIACALCVCRCSMDVQLLVYAAYASQHLPVRLTCASRQRWGARGPLHMGGKHHMIAIRRMQA